MPAPDPIASTVAALLADAISVDEVDEETARRVADELSCELCSRADAVIAGPLDDQRSIELWAQTASRIEDVLRHLQHRRRSPAGRDVVGPVRDRAEAFRALAAVAPAIRRHRALALRAMASALEEIPTAQLADVIAAVPLTVGATFADENGEMNRVTGVRLGAFLANLIRIEFVRRVPADAGGPGVSQLARLREIQRGLDLLGQSQSLSPTGPLLDLLSADESQWATLVLDEMGHLRLSIEPWWGDIGEAMWALNDGDSVRPDLAVAAAVLERFVTLPLDVDRYEGMMRGRIAALLARGWHSLDVQSVEPIRRGAALAVALLTVYGLDRAVSQADTLRVRRVADAAAAMGTLASNAAMLSRAEANATAAMAGSGWLSWSVDDAMSAAIGLACIAASQFDVASSEAPIARLSDLAAHARSRLGAATGEGDPIVGRFALRGLRAEWEAPARWARLVGAVWGAARNDLATPRAIIATIDAAGDVGVRRSPFDGGNHMG